MTYTVKNELMTSVEKGHYRAEFDGKDVYVFNTELGQKIVYSGSMEESLEMAGMLRELNKQVKITKIIKEETL